METDMKLKPEMFALEELNKTKKTLEYIRSVLSTYELTHDHAHTIKYLEGYACAMNKIVIQAEL